MKKRLIVVLTSILFVLLALNAVRYFLRIDITASRVNSISSVSRELARNLSEPVSVRYYVSDKLRARATEPDQIIDILQEYAAFSRGLISVEIVDPIVENITAEIEEIGIIPQQIQVVERDQQSYATVYTGIVIRYLNRTRVLPVVFSPGAVEYQLSSSIKGILTDERRVVGLLLPENAQTLARSFNHLQEHLQKDFEVEILEKGQPISQEVTVLLILPDDSFDNDTAFAIDQYLLEGRPALFAMNGHEVDLNTTYLLVFSTGPSETSVHNLLRHHGIGVNPELLLDVRNQRIPVVQTAAGFRFQGLAPYAHWVSIFDTVNLEHPITSRFSGLDLFWPTPLEITDSAGVEELITSSNESWIMRGKPVVKPEENYLFEINADETRGSHPVAVVKTGALTHYDALDIPDTANPDEILTETQDSRIVVLGDREFLSDLIQITGSGYNLEFATNLVDWLGNDEDLLNIRTRATRNTRLNRIQDADLAYSLKQAVQWISIVGIPFLVILIGFFRFLRRRNTTRRS